jgi:hypothetical protein
MKCSIPSGDEETDLEDAADFDEDLSDDDMLDEEAVAFSDDGQ